MRAVVGMLTLAATVLGAETVGGEPSAAGAATMGQAPPQQTRVQLVDGGTVTVQAPPSTIVVEQQPVRIIVQQAPPQVEVQPAALTRWGPVDRPSFGPPGRTGEEVQAP
jgi:hypothetical protein